MWLFAPKTGHEGVFGARPRSGRWAAIRERWLLEHGVCEACGNTDRNAIQVHHRVPVHVCPELECSDGSDGSDSNLVTLCSDGPGRSNCHFIFGHLGLTWADWNPQVEEDAARFMRRRTEAVDRREDSDGKTS